MEEQYEWGLTVQTQTITIKNLEDTAYTGKMQLKHWFLVQKIREFYFGQCFAWNEL